MRIDVFSIFPEMVDEFARHSLLNRAREQNHVDLRCHDLRAGATDRHRSVDDEPYGGGAGMVMSPEPVFSVVESVDPPRPLIALSPRGEPFDQSTAESLASLDGFSLLCGRYEGLDERIHTHLCDQTLSVGDVVLAGGEVAAMVVIEAVTRLVPGVMGNDNSGLEESFSDGLLEYPHYTRPQEFRGWQVPAVLRSGNHAQIARWRHAMALKLTLDRRPDLIERRGGLSARDEEMLVWLDDLG
jgi:tRNA (guanine37-N1)-methyltransferase